MTERKKYLSADTPLPLEQYRELLRIDVPFRSATPDQDLTFEAAVTAALTALTKEQQFTGVPDIAGLEFKEKRRLLQHLLTIRPAAPFLDSANHQFIGFVLSAELEQKALTDAAVLPTVAEMFPDTNYPTAAKTALWQGDISTLKIDAIVNAANAQMLGCFQPFHACIDNVIHTAAGPRLREDCHLVMQEQGHLEGTGWAKITRGYYLPSRFVLHTVGPIILTRQGQNSSEQKDQLAASYRACLELAARVDGIRSVAFCCISTGVFGFPQEPAAQIALDTVNAWLNEHPQALDLVVFNVFTNTDLQIYNEKLS